MKEEASPFLVVRIFLPLIVLGIFHILPTPTGLTSALKTLSAAPEKTTPAAVVEAATHALAYQPWRVGLWVVIGNNELQQSHFTAAADAYQKALQAKALTIPGEYALARAYELNHLPQNALSVYLDLIEKGPSAEAFKNAYRLQADAHDWAGVERTLRAWAQVDPADGSVAYDLGKVLAVSKPGEAMQWLEQAGKLRKDLDVNASLVQHAVQAAPDAAHPGKSFVTVGRALASTGDWPLAAFAFEMAVKADPGYADGWAFLGVAHQHMGQGGSKELDQARRLAPDAVSVKALSAMFYTRSGQPELALVYLNQVIESDPGQAVWQVEMGNLLANMGDIAAGMTHIQKALTLEPNNAYYWRVLAEFCFTNEYSMREVGIPAARQAILLAPDDAQSLDLMGWGMLKEGDLTSAERFLQQAVNNDPQSASVHLHLGQLFIEKQQVLQARQELETALQLAGKDSVIGQSAERLMDRFINGY
jgi:tetratricopeptide (TPR) repeat protein